MKLFFESYLVLGLIGSLVWNIVEPRTKYDETSFEWQIVFPILIGPLSFLVAVMMIWRKFFEREPKRRYYHFVKRD